MTAHPIELIAGMDDGVDLDQKDQVTRHIAACDGCRSVARTMQRIDGLIARPEPTLPLPERASPRAGVRVAGWAFAFAVVVTLVATMAVLVGSSRHTQVSSSDACGVLAAAARSAGVGAASAKASAIKLPTSLAGSWTACGYGDIATRSGPLVLFRSEPTAAWEVRGLLEGLTSTDLGTQLHFGGFVPCSGDALTERWITVDGTCGPERLGARERIQVEAAQALESQAGGSGTGPTMAVVAEPYFFVVTAPSRGATKRLADAIVAELGRRPSPPLSIGIPPGMASKPARCRSSCARTRPQPPSKRRPSRATRPLLELEEHAATVPIRRECEEDVLERADLGASQHGENRRSVLGAREGSPTAVEDQERRNPVAAQRVVEHRATQVVDKRDIWIADDADW